METQDLKEKEFDALISKLLAKDAPSVSEKFTDSVMNKIANVAKTESVADKSIDNLLRKQRDFPNITEATLTKIRRLNRTLLERFVSYSSAIAVAACVVVSVILASANASLPQGVLTEDDFAEMSKIDDDIQNITFLVMQEEILDIIRK